MVTKTKVTKGPNGKKVKFKKKTNNLLKEIAQALLLLCQTETVKTPKARTDEVYFTYRIHDKLISLGPDPSTVIPQMINKGYLVIRSKDPESYYVFTIPGQGKRLAPHIAAK